MRKAKECLVILGLLISLSGCSEDSLPGVSYAAEAPVRYLNNQPAYIQQALDRAGNLSTSPHLLVSICDTNGKKAGLAESSLAKYVMRCVENVGME